MKTIDQLRAEWSDAYDAYEAAWDAHIDWKEPFYAGSFVPFRSWPDLHDTIEEQSPFRPEMQRTQQIYMAAHDAMISHPDYPAAPSNNGLKEDWQND